jgi:hypothetical protein
LGVSSTSAVTDFGRIERLPQIFYSIVPIGAFSIASGPRGASEEAPKYEKNDDEFEPTAGPEVVAKAIDLSKPRGFKVDIVPPVDTTSLDNAIFNHYDARKLLQLITPEE